MLAVGPGAIKPSFLTSTFNQLDYSWAESGHGTANWLKAIDHAESQQSAQAQSVFLTISKS